MTEPKEPQILWVENDLEEIAYRENDSDITKLATWAHKEPVNNSTKYIEHSAYQSLQSELEASKLCNQCGYTWMSGAKVDEIMKDGYLSKGAGDMWEPSSSYEDISDLAQAILNDYLDKHGVEVFSNDSTVLGWTKHKAIADTHKALLIDVEEIKECEHKKVRYEEPDFICGDCGKKIIPTGFKVKE